MAGNVNSKQKIWFYAMPVVSVLQYFGTSKNGLDLEKVKNQREKYGWNEIPEAKKDSWLKLLFKQFKNLLVVILIVAAVISYVAGHQIDMYVILAVILINALIGFIQEMKAEQAVSALKKMLVHKARVVRGGKESVIPSRELVPGDIIILEEGESVPADARIIESKNLQVTEASLTGESVPESKNNETVTESTPLADQKNMLFKSTFVTGGFAKAVVCGTGLDTAVGEIAETLSNIKRAQTNFQKKTTMLGHQMAVISIISAVVLFTVGYISGNYEFNELLLVSMAALVSVIPEGLPVVLSVVLAIGSYRMSKRNAIIRDITSVETLGAVTTIITDKTGTLTQNKLTVRKVYMFGDDPLDVSGEGWLPAGNFSRHKKIIEPNDETALMRLLEIAAYSNNASIKHTKDSDTYELAGDPTEGALLVLAAKAGLKFKPSDELRKMDDLPFNSKLKMRASLIEISGEKFLFVIGAPEKILEVSKHVSRESSEVLIDDSIRNELSERMDLWSADAMRVIGLAYKKLPDSVEKIDEALIKELVFSGLTGMIDPPRPNTKEAVLQCKNAGIRVIMATGDHINTAVAIAKAVGILEEQIDDELLALNEQQLLQLDEKEFDDVIQKVSVFARLTPKVKLRIAERLQAMGELVAMTGDGVNDAPALKKADIGVAMGIMGTDVAREASQVVLADDNFATIVNAIEEGRIVFSNARKTSFFLVTTNFAEITTLISLVAMGLPMALTATQILWLNLITDGLCDKPLAAERGHKDLLKDKPVKQNEKILNKSVLPFLFMMAGIMTVLSLIVYFRFIDVSLEKARTAVFIVMAFSQLFNLYNMRSLKKSIFEIGFFSNKYINLAILASVIVQIVIIEMPFFQHIFSFEYVSVYEFLILISLSSIVLWTGELYKFIKYKVAL
ncbi:MAG: HAD-IC family P-type ATPase [Flavobacteriaceae bacterium]|nr:HAD-IC family P-type ATPase [Flavobacteriaceae bacterium]